MDWIWIVTGSILLIIGLIGCIIPIIPGPPISFIGLLSLQLTETYNFTTNFLLIMLLVAGGVTALDYIVPVYGTKKFGGSKKGIWGSIIGLFLGIFFFPPIGIIIGPFIGALTGELIGGKNTNEALKSGFGSFIGLLFGTILKLAASATMTYYFIIQII